MSESSPYLPEEFAGTERFAILRRLGAGGMGVVYEAFDRERNERVALKKLSKVDPFLIYQFKREFRSLAEIVHPNLLPLYELFAEDEQWFFTMELIESPVNLLVHIWGNSPPGAETAGTQLTETVGFTLSEATDLAADSGSTMVVPARKKPNRQGVDWDRLRGAFAQLAEGVNALHHQNMLHRDLKPENVLVRANGCVVLLDFGLVAGLRPPAPAGGPSGSAAGSSRVFQTPTDGFVAGTVSYMSPEQAAAHPLTPASDWYSVGVMLFRALTGYLPFTGPTKQVLADKQRYEPHAPAELVDGIPEDLSALCRDLLRLDPLKRPSGSHVLAYFAGRTATPEETDPVDDTPFVGRAPQLAAMYEAFGRAVAGFPCICHVHGPSGSGKSALVDRFLSDLAQRAGILVLTGRCYEQESVPFKAVDGLVDDLCVHLTQASCELNGWTPADLSALIRVFPVLRHAFLTFKDPAERRFFGLRDLHGRAVAALGELLERICQRYTLVLYIDDLQWGDLDSATLLKDLLQAPALRRVLLVTSYRSEYREISPFLRAFHESGEGSSPLTHTEIEVTPLSEDETRELAVKLLGGDSQSRDIAVRIVRESRGSAFFVYELVRYVRAGMDVESGGKIELDEILWRRAGALPEDARILLESIAVAGVPIYLSDACSAGSISLPTHGSMTQLRAGHFIRKFGIAVDDQVETYHDRVRESVVAHLPGPRRKEYHAGLVTALESSGRAEPETIAAHCLAAGDPRAARYYELAADRAVQRLAFNRAEEYFRQAADLSDSLLDRARVYEKMIHFYTDVARFDEAYALGCRAAGMFGVKLPKRFNPPVLIADVIMARIRVARRGMDGILHLPELTDEGSRAVVRLISAVAKAAYQVRPELCVAVSAKCVNLCLRKGNVGEAVVPYMVYGCIFLGGVLGQYRIGNEFGRLALRLVEKYDNRKQRAEVHFVVGYFATSWLQPATEAERLWKIAYESGLDTNDLFHTGCACAGTIQSLYMRGAPLDQVWHESERMLEVLRRTQLREPIGCLTSVRQCIRELRGDPDPKFDDAAFAADVSQFGSRHFAHFYFLNRMQLLYLRGEMAAARAMAARSASYQSDSRGMLHSAEHVFYSGLIAAARGERWEVAKARRRFEKWAALCPHNFEHKFRLLAAEEARLRASQEEAARLYDAAAQSAARFEYWQVHALANRLAAALHSSCGDDRRALACAEAAADSWRRWGATALANLNGANT